MSKKRKNQKKRANKLNVMLLKLKIINLQLIPFKLRKITSTYKKIRNKIKHIYAKAVLPIRVKLAHYKQVGAKSGLLKETHIIGKLIRLLFLILKPIGYIKKIFRIEFAVTVMAIAVLINFSVLLMERYELKLFQRANYLEAKQFIRTYAKAYGFGAEKITVMGKEYDITEPPVYKSKTYKGSDKLTECTIIITSKIEGNRPVFNVSEPHNHCIDLITRDRNFHTWKTQLFDGR